MEPLSKILEDKTSPSESKRMKGTHEGTLASPKQPSLLFITGFQYKTKSTDHVSLSCLENKLGKNIEDEPGTKSLFWRQERLFPSPLHHCLLHRAGDSRIHVCYPGDVHRTLTVGRSIKI